MNPTMVLSSLALLSGFGIRYWINRRKFYRRSPLGAESFSSYEKSVFISFLERTGKWIAYILIIFGLLLLWSYSKQQKDNKVLIQKEVPFKHDQNPK
ncbi:hypothetical protein SAMN05444395_11161 [Flavobacterium fryxellicola]|uniref:Molybdenum ABC transporter permease n=1 Tax=Flavobacterium fryxellicola TaxID=249352 RepID=A0A167ZLK8_9FLAO|nr:molybdenum ABC transporter permease [Flavobacterium fryxellicola]OAB30580.1 molybdenum ABC transporter permease [Flavobacterium fryxellicola]SHN77151.1 hypothetical protein SAMN05444395_11161 [Flavobacterium fryxellicola]